MTALEDDRVPSLECGSVSRICFDQALTLHFVTGALTTVEGEFTFVTQSATALIQPGQWAGASEELIALLDSNVEARADGGVLTLSIDGAVRVTVQPDSTFETWAHHNPDGTSIISTPGGDLAVFAPTKDGQ